MSLSSNGIRKHFSILLLVLSFVFSIEVIAKSVKPKGLTEKNISSLKFDGDCSELQSGENARIKNIIQQFNGTLKDPYIYPDTIDGFHQFIQDSGVSDFSGRTLVALPPADTPDSFELSRRTDALACGLRNLMPPQCRWYMAAALLLVMQNIQREVGIQVGRIRHWFRPNCYNRRRGGAASSDHRHARAIDFDFTYPMDRRKSQERLCHYFWKHRNVDIQVGRGCQTLHVGFESPRGRRTWTYASLFQSSCAPQQSVNDGCRWQTGFFAPEQTESQFEDQN